MTTSASPEKTNGRVTSPIARVRLRAPVELRLGVVGLAHWPFALLDAKGQRVMLDGASPKTSAARLSPQVALLGEDGGVVLANVPARKYSVLFLSSSGDTPSPVMFEGSKNEEPARFRLDELYGRGVLVSLDLAFSSQEGRFTLALVPTDLNCLHRCC